MRKTARRILGCCILVLAFFCALYMSFGQERVFRECKNGSVPRSISLVGDIIIGSDGEVWHQIVRNGYDPASIFESKLLDQVRESDVIFANLEGVITSSVLVRKKTTVLVATSTSSGFVEIDVDANVSESQFVESTPEFSIKVSKDVIRFFKNIYNGPVVLSFANNHAADFGEQGISDILSFATEFNVPIVGIGHDDDEAAKAKYFDISGTRVAFLASTDLLPQSYFAREDRLGVAELTEKKLRSSIKEAKLHADVVIVALHTGGGLFSIFSYEPDEGQKRFAEIATAAGADIVVGSHPHGLQKVEKRGGKLIAYSLGAFIYNPTVSQKYSKGNPFYGPTQFKGGGLLEVYICKGEGVVDFEVVPTKSIRSKNRTQVGRADD